MTYAQYYAEEYRSRRAQGQPRAQLNAVASAPPPSPITPLRVDLCGSQVETVLEPAHVGELAGPHRPRQPHADVVHPAGKRDADTWNEAMNEAVETPAGRRLEMRLRHAAANARPDLSAVAEPRGVTERPGVPSS